MKKPPALIVTYNPSSDFENHLELLFKEFEQIIIVDNGSPRATQQMLQQQAAHREGALHLLFNPQNLGIATALNQGFDWAIQHQYHFVISLDQDSLPEPGITRAMLDVYDTHPNRDQIAIVASAFENPDAGIIAQYLQANHFLFFKRKRCTGRVLENVSIVITSGSMYNLKIYEQLGPFRDDFFIDYVDTEYCLRVKKQGFNIIVACNARLRHRLGNQRKFKVGPLEIRPTFHSVLRWYYISRNRIPVMWQYGFHFPHWLLYELTINSYGFFRMLLFEDHKLGKILAVMLGCWDGIFGRAGAIPDFRKKVLSKFEQTKIV